MLQFFFWQTNHPKWQTTTVVPTIIPRLESRDTETRGIKRPRSPIRSFSDEEHNSQGICIHLLYKKNYILIIVSDGQL